VYHNGHERTSSIQAAPIAIVGWRFNAELLTPRLLEKKGQLICTAEARHRIGGRYSVCRV